MAHGGVIAMVITKPTKTLLVNPAFLQEIKDSNPDCWGLVNQLQQLVQTVDQPAPCCAS